MPEVPASQLVTLGAVADLAHVQRPVVSMWRTRAAGSAHPFPTPVDRSGGREVFRLAEVVTWLERTGRGNNPAARQDAAAAAALDLLPDAERRTAVDGLAALLTIAARTRSPLGHRTAAELLDLADEVDPHDRCLYAEVAALAEQGPAWARHADALANATYSAPAAVAHLDAFDRRLRARTDGEHPLAPAAIRLLGALADALNSEDDPLVVQAGGVEAARALAARRGEPGTVLLDPAAGVESRRARRVLLGEGWQVEDCAADALPARATLLATMIGSASATASIDTILDLLSEVEARLPPEAHALVLAPADALCEPLPVHDQSTRATVLRSGRVRAVIRLPHGLLPAQPRRRLALWVLGPASGDVRDDRHRTPVADLAADRLDDGAIEDLVTDVAASVSGSGAGHAFRFVRPVQTLSLLATSGSLVTARPTSRRPREGAESLALALRTTWADLQAPVAPLAAWQVVIGESAGAFLVTLGDLVDRRHLRLVRGSRLDPADLTSASGAAVHTPASLAGTAAPARLDRLRLADTYPAAHLTAQGDVVFVGGPHPAAVVDRDGLAVMAAPVRALRVADGAPPGLVPEVLAHAIGTAPPGVGWRHWAVPVVPTAHAATVAAVLAEIAAARAATAARLATLDRLTSQVVTATTTGSVTLISPASIRTMEG